MKKLNSEIHEIDEIKSFKELINIAVKKYPDNIAYKFKRNIGKQDQYIVEKTYSQVKEEVEHFSTALLNLGIENSKVAVIGNNRYEWCITYFAVTTSNMVIVPLDKLLPEREIENLVVRSGVETIVFEEKYTDIFLKLKEKGIGKIKNLISMDLQKEINGVLSYSELVEKGKKLLKEGNELYKNINIDNEKMSALLFTSGTTAQSKGVMLSQKNITSNIMAMAKMAKIYSTDTILSFLPLHHTFECTITFLYGFYSGATVAFCDGLKYIAQNLVEYKISVFVAVPLVLETMYKKIENGIEKSGKAKIVKLLSSVTKFLNDYLHIDIRRKVFKSVLDNLGGNIRILFFGAAPMSKDVIVGYNIFGVDTLQGYGLTETSPLAAAETDLQKRPGSVGMAPYNVELRLVDIDEQGIGEIQVKGPNVMLGYFENENATNDVLKDGWFSTGDLGYYDKDGYLFISGRKKEVIVLKNGENVYPNDIEFLINKLPYVAESILFPRPNEKNELNLGIKIVYDETLVNEQFGNKEQSEYEKLVWEDIKNINQSLPQFKRIKEIIITTEPLEKTTTQKIKRFKEIEKILK
ncbi:MAG TPA: AMP-binding protein [Clostridia bacterium]|nr:AMP-binding protein [Clostridia bacterium]